MCVLKNVPILDHYNMLESMGLGPERSRLEGMRFTDLDHAGGEIKELILGFTGGEGTSSAWQLSRLDQLGCVVGAAQEVKMVEEVSGHIGLTADGVEAIMELFRSCNQDSPVLDRIGDVDWDTYLDENPDDGF